MLNYKTYFSFQTFCINEVHVHVLEYCLFRWTSFWVALMSNKQSQTANKPQHPPCPQCLHRLPLWNQSPIPRYCWLWSYSKYNEWGFHYILSFQINLNESYEILMLVLTAEFTGLVKLILRYCCNHFYIYESLLNTFNSIWIRQQCLILHFFSYQFFSVSILKDSPFITDKSSFTF